VVTNNAGLSQDPDDTVGSNSITIWPDEYLDATRGLAKVYLIGHVPSVGTDDVLIKAFRLINNNWVMMNGGGGANEITAPRVGTGLKEVTKDGQEANVADRTRDSTS